MCGFFLLHLHYNVYLCVMLLVSFYVLTVRNHCVEVDIHTKRLNEHVSYKTSSQKKAG